MDLAKTAGEDLARIRETAPLVHHITNFVVMNETANITLCLGALPVMAHAREEVAEMVGFAGALVLNIGTLTPELVESMIVAGLAANEKGVPVVLDPVGVGATTLRTESAEKILREVHVSVIRGNAAEVTALGGEDAEIRGVESIGTYEGIRQAAQRLATDQECVVSVTGEIDHVTDGQRTFSVDNGHPLLGTVTGTGCMSTTIAAGFAAVQDDHTVAVAGALAAFGLAGEVAAETAAGPGSFHAGLYDAMAALTPADLAQRARITEE
jgi:hydroxyethylthiazole kinase